MKMNKKLVVNMALTLTILLSVVVVYGETFTEKRNAEKAVEVYFTDLIAADYSNAARWVPLDGEKQKTKWIRWIEQVAKEEYSVEKLVDVSLEKNEFGTSATVILHYKDNGQIIDRVAWVTMEQEETWKIQEVTFADENGNVDHPLATALSDLNSN